MSHDSVRNAQAQMKKAIASFEQSLLKIRTGRAHPGLLSTVMVVSYEAEVPISQVASVSVGDAQTLVVSPWDKAMLPALEKAILSAGLGLNPSSNGEVVHVPLPALTAERRKDLAKIVRQDAESTRVVIRNIRRDAISALRECIKKKEMSEDEERRLALQVQQLTDEHIGKVDQRLLEKEKDLLTV